MRDGADSRYAAFAARRRGKVDGTTFDKLAKRLHRTTSRRSALALAAAGLGGLASVRTARAAFPASCRHFAISGSRNIRKNFIYDDDMAITLIRRNGERETLLRDRDGKIGVGNDSVAPLKFSARPGDWIRIVARDRTGNCYSMEDLVLHCCTNRQCRESRDSKRLTAGVREKCFDADKWKTRVFFNELFKI
jgi:hypothetical protein